MRAIMEMQYHKKWFRTQETALEDHFRNRARKTNTKLVPQTRANIQRSRHIAEIKREEIRSQEKSRQETRLRKLKNSTKFGHVKSHLQSSGTAFFVVVHVNEAVFRGISRHTTSKDIRLVFKKNVYQ